MLKAGRFANINGVVCRAKKAISGCNECIFDNVASCPGATLLDEHHQPFECINNGIIFNKI